MSQADIILQAMRPDHDYTPLELSTKTHIDKHQVSKILNMLHRGGLIEQITKDRYLKGRKYKTKQMRLRGL